MNKEQKNEYIKIILIALVVGVLAFGAGTQYQKRKVGSFLTGGNPGAGQSFRNGGGMMNGGARSGMTGGNRGGFRPVSGEIISQDENSITVKLADGSSKIIFLAQSTSINKADQGSAADLQTGKQVAVFGTENADGTVTANTIQIDPQRSGMGMMRESTPSASKQPAQKTL